jgi:O-antigen/teichoic acid export membrane protein
MPDSILRRSLISAQANVAKAVLSFATGILLARGLGPEQYGVFAFLLASFTALRAVLDMGSSSAFFSFISKRNRSRSFIAYYLLWVLIQFLLPLFFIVLIAPDEWVKSIWEGEEKSRVIVAFVAVFLQQQMWSIVAQIGESQRLTVKVQLLNISIACFHLTVVGVLYWVEGLTIERVYYFISLEIVVATLVALKVFPLVYSDELSKPSAMLREYWVFCYPLIPYAWLGMVIGFADTWLLQHFGGAVEQAYYSVAAQFASISLIATTSVLRILWKEVAEANERGDKTHVQRIYERANRILFVLGASISGMLIPWTEEIIQLVLGNSYLEGAFVMALMFLYPIHQSLGQINGTMFFALELTRPYVLIGMVSMLISGIAVYFIIAPPTALLPGLGLASTGLALKMVVLQFLGVNFSIWWLSKNQGWKFYFVYQLVLVGLFLLLGFAAYYLVNFILDESVFVILRGGLAGMVYLFICALLLYRFPQFVGFTRSEINHYLPRLGIGF